MTVWIVLRTISGYGGPDREYVDGVFKSEQAANAHVRSEPGLDVGERWQDVFEIEKWEVEG